MKPDGNFEKKKHFLQLLNALIFQFASLDFHNKMLLNIFYIFIYHLAHIMTPHDPDLPIGFLFDRGL